MDRSIQIARLVSSGLACLQHIIETYPTDGRIYFKVIIGSEGTGPEISVFFRGSQYDKAALEVDIQLWLHPQDTMQSVLIYTAFNPQTDEIDHQTENLSDFLAVQPYFDRAVRHFGIKPYRDNP